MSQAEKAKEIANVIEHYIDHSTNSHDLGVIAALINDSSYDIGILKERITKLYDYSDSMKIRKTIDLLEYLTVHCQDKLLPLLNADRLVDRFQYIIDSEFSQPVLNLLKLWCDKYIGNQAKILPIFDFIENLSHFDFHLPDHYVSRFEGGNNSGPANPQDPLPSKNEYIRLSIRELTEVANQLIEENRKIMDGSALANKSRDVKTALIRHNLLKADQIREAFEGLKKCDIWFIVASTVEKIHNELIECNIKLQNKLTEVQLFEEEMSDRTPATTTPVTYTSTDQDYKIVFSPVDGELSVEDFVEYKINECPQGQTCEYAPLPGGKIPSTDSTEFMCPFWHNPSDRRRAICDERGDYSYKPQKCKYRETCGHGDNCLYSHNFFEANFHPRNYKKAPCREPPGACKRKKYCPYYHSIQERDNIRGHLRNMFDLGKEDGSESYMTEWDLEDGASAYSLNDQMPAQGRELMVYQEKPPIPGHLHHEMQEESRSMASWGEGTGHHHSHFDSYNKQEIPPNTLQAKLVIRKKYENPSKLTSYFHQAKIMNGYPFFFFWKPSQSQSTEEIQEEQIIVSEEKK